MTMRGARPFKVKLYLICLNNKCFDFKPMLYILILMVLNFRNFGIRAEKSSESVNEINAIV